MLKLHYQINEIKEIGAMTFFKVIAKCGHVGRKYYYKGEFFVKAESGKMAAAIVRNAPRVKHHHKDAILDVIKIGYEDYVGGKITYSVNPYFNCHSRQQQKYFLYEIQDSIFFEETKNFFSTERRKDRLVKLKILKKLERKAIKYGECAVV